MSKRVLLSDEMEYIFVPEQVGWESKLYLKMFKYNSNTDQFDLESTTIYEDFSYFKHVLARDSSLMILVSGPRMLFVSGVK